MQLRGSLSTRRDRKEEGDGEKDERKEEKMEDTK